MTKSKSPARQVQRLTKWTYTESLRFVYTYQNDAEAYARDQQIPYVEAYLALARAELENG